MFCYRGIIFIAHGYSEHSGLYQKFDECLCSELDIVVVGHDRGTCTDI